MRDVILVRNGAGVTFKHPQAAHFANLLVVTVSGVKLAVTRGWTAIDAKVRGSHQFRFVNTHLEAFDPATQVPSIRALQAASWSPRAARRRRSLPVVLLGDLNSDDDTVEPGDQQAYRTLLGAGHARAQHEHPLGCCLNSSLLAVGAGGSIADFNHQVDHVMTRDPKEIKLKASAVTGRQPVNGFWDSDHAGPVQRPAHSRTSDTVLPTGRRTPRTRTFRPAGGGSSPRRRCGRRIRRLPSPALR